MNGTKYYWSEGSGSESFKLKRETVATTTKMMSSICKMNKPKLIMMRDKPKSTRFIISGMENLWPKNSEKEKDNLQGSSNLILRPFLVAYLFTMITRSQS